jgi:hypothetical protein
MNHDALYTALVCCRSGEGGWQTKNLSAEMLTAPAGLERTER